MFTVARPLPRLSFLLRLIVILYCLLRHMFTLLRQGDRNLKILIRSREMTEKARVNVLKKIGCLLTGPLRHYFAVLLASPRIAGTNSEKYIGCLHETRKHMKKLSLELTNGRSFLLSPSVRKLQRQLVPMVFDNLFSIKINSEQAISFSFYAESSELVRDFLDFCHHNNQFGGKEDLLAAMPVFAEMVKGYFYKDSIDPKHGPQAGELCKKPLKTWARDRLRSNWFRPDLALINLYWSNIDLKEILGQTNLSASSRRLLEQHFVNCTKSRSETLLGVIAFEMHQRANRDLVSTAIQFGPASLGQLYASPVSKEQITLCLAELESSLRQVNGISKTSLAPQLEW